MNTHGTPFERREFLKRLGFAGAGLMLAGPFGRAFAAEDGGAAVTVPRRKFGRHDITVSSLCLGGHTLRVADDAEAARLVDTALDLGIDFFDNSWDYHGGKSEDLMGRLMKGRRDRIFLMTKVCVHDGNDEEGDYKMAMRMLEESLRRLGTDHLDLWQWHAVATMDQVKRGFAPEGVVKALTDAKKQGKVRYVGFTGHTDPEVHLAVLAEKYPFDACQLPVSAIEANSDAFVRRVLPELVKQGIAPLAMKSLGGGGQPVRDKVITVEEGIGYALSQPVATVVTGVDKVDYLRQNARVAANFKPWTAEKLAALEERVLPATESKKYQPYRKWMSYRDGDAAMYRGLV